MELTKTRIHAGVWEGVLTTGSDEMPEVDVTHLEAPLDGVMVDPLPDQKGCWRLRIAIPVEVLSDGVQTFLIRSAASGEKLGSFTVLTGELLDDDIRGEIDLLRAELDMLKRAFRRHCLETM